MSGSGVDLVSEINRQKNMKQSSKEFEREVKNAGLGILVGRLFFLSWGVDKLKEIKENNTLVSELGY